MLFEVYRYAVYLCALCIVPVYGINVCCLQCTSIRYKYVLLQCAGIWYKCVLFTVYRYTV